MGAKQKVEAKKELAAKRRQLTQAERRIEELDRLFKRIYEDNANGKQTGDMARRWVAMSLFYVPYKRNLSYALSINASISRLICSGLSVLELCPAPFIHSIGIPVFLCHALLYRIQEPA